MNGIDRRGLMGLAALASGIAVAARAQPWPGWEPTRSIETMALWPNGAPGGPTLPLVETTDERSTDASFYDRALHGISNPRMAVFRPDRPNGAAVLITPGGGFKWVVVDKEGYEMARWLAARGYTAFVLFYRLPGEGWASGPDTSLADAQRAMRLVRHRADEYGIDPARIAAMGFSAGGHVCADLAARFGQPVYAPVDAADRLSARPFCAAPIYPVVSMDPAIAHPGSRKLLLGEHPSAAREAAHSPDRNISADAPPHFLLHAEDDEVVPIENTLRLRAALKSHGVPVETHLFGQGGHGFGLRKTVGKPTEVWPELWRAWARPIGLEGT